ncbi:MAG TPA: hypothetical protein VF129_07665 [Actinomycetota bacterium]
MRVASSAELDRIRSGIPEALRDVLPDELDKVREATAAEFERVREQIPDQVERAVIARMGAITVADPAQGEDAEPR